MSTYEFREIIFLKNVIYPCDSGREEIVELLINNSAEINRRDKNDKSALDIAVEKKFGKIIEILVQNGADITSKNKDGKTVLDIANERGNKRIEISMKEYLQISI